jgi:hypothetical protein
MTGSADLERRYSRLLAWYPAAFRRDHEAEMLGVLMDSARGGQRRIGLADAADLIRGALAVRLRVSAQAPRTVVAAVRLMRVGALAYLAAWISTLVTEGSVRSAMLRSAPASWHLMLVHVVAIETVVPAAVVGWLWLSWANGRGHDRARLVLVPYFGFATLGLLWTLGTGAAAYAPADLISLTVLWLIQLCAIVLVFNKRSECYYRPAEGSAHPE